MREPEAFERVEVWLDVTHIREEPLGLLFRPIRTEGVTGGEVSPQGR
jgi:hypothetical protein